jgi:hypothetical protein
MKLFGRNMRYCPEETAAARRRAIESGDRPRDAAKRRAYIVTTEDDLFEKYRFTFGIFSVIRMHLVLSLEYLFRRLKRRFSKRISHPPETCRQPDQKE